MGSNDRTDRWLEERELIVDYCGAVGTMGRLAPWNGAVGMDGGETRAEAGRNERLKQGEGDCAGVRRRLRTSCGRCPYGITVLAILLLMKAGVILASSPKEWDHSLKISTHTSKHHGHHHRHSQQLEEPKHRLRHSGGLDFTCTKCPPGWGVVSPCQRGVETPNGTAHKDTVCSPCAAGTYSPHHSAKAECWPCSRCSAGLFESHPCTLTTDTTCDSCLTGRARPLGEDFDRKCLFGRSSGDVSWYEDDALRRVLRRTSTAAFRLSGQMRPRGEGGGESSQEEERHGVKWAHKGEMNETDGESMEGGSREREEEERRKGGKSAGLTWGVVSIAGFQFSVFAAAAAAVCHYVRKMHSCLAEDKERTAQEVNPLMEVTATH